MSAPQLDLVRPPAAPAFGKIALIGPADQTEALAATIHPGQAAQSLVQIGDAAGSALAQSADLVVLCGLPGGGTLAGLAEIIDPMATLVIASSCGDAALTQIEQAFPSQRRIRAHFASAIPGGLSLCFLSPMPQKVPPDPDRVAAVWARSGMDTRVLSPAEYDRVLAVLVQLPSLVRCNVMDTARAIDAQAADILAPNLPGAQLNRPSELCDACLGNREAVLDALSLFIEGLMAFQKMIRWQETDNLETALAAAEGVLGQPKSPPDSPPITCDQHS